jgi:hypothetical protein
MMAKAFRSSYRDAAPLDSFFAGFHFRTTHERNCRSPAIKATSLSTPHPDRETRQTAVGHRYNIDTGQREAS